MKALAQCEGLDDERHFPAEVFRSPALHSPRDRWLDAPSQMFNAIGEPSLACGAAPESYRVTWLHSFSGSTHVGALWPPTMVRVFRNGSGWTARAAQLTSGFMRTDVRHLARELSSLEAQRVLAEVTAFGLWTRPEFASDPEVFDGALWIAEGRRGTSYHPAFLANADTWRVKKLMTVFLEVAGIDPRMLQAEAKNGGWPSPPR